MVDNPMYMPDAVLADLVDTGTPTPDTLFPPNKRKLTLTEHSNLETQCFATKSKPHHVP